LQEENPNFSRRFQLKTRGEVEEDIFPFLPTLRRHNSSINGDSKRTPRSESRKLIVSLENNQDFFLIREEKRREEKKREEKRREERSHNRTTSYKQHPPSWRTIAATITRPRGRRKRDLRDT